MQLLFYLSPLSALLLLPAWPYFDDLETKFYNFDSKQIIPLLLSCTAAFFVNVSTFLLIGRTSPLTYNAVGHAKLMAILVGGVLLFNNPITTGNVIGVIITFSGLFWYTSITIKESEKRNAPPKEVANETANYRVKSSRKTK